MPALLVAQSTDSTVKREYFVQQAANEALLIRVNAYEAEIESRVFAPDRILLLSSELPKNRIAPLFQFIDNTSKERQLDIEITSTQNTANSEYGIAVTRLAAWDNRSAALMRAYALLSFATQVQEVDTAANWTVKINSLMRATETFDQYGMKELRLWSTYFTAHLIQYRLHDYNLVLGICREILKETRASQWREIELATQKLRSAAYIGLSGTGKLQRSVNDPDPVQSSLARTASLANSMGYRFEQAQAINQSGLEYVHLSSLPQALEQFQLALEISDSIGDASLSKSIRESVASIHAGQGDDPATNKVLQEIESQLAEDGGGDELALNLLQQGRIYIRSYQYPEAERVLLQALNFENDSSIRRQINLELAKTHFETGQNEEMLTRLTEAGINKQQAPSHFSEGYRAVLADSSTVRHGLEAQYLRSRSLARNGQRRQSLEVLEQLIDEVLFLRQSLPGVVGAWYWSRSRDLIEDYLALQMADGTRSLLALSKMRVASKPSLLVVDTSALRAALSQREDVRSDDNNGQLNTSIEQEMNTLRAAFNSEFTSLSKADLSTHIGSLVASEAVLTYYLSRNMAYVWVVKAGKVTQRKLANASSLYADLQGVTTGISGSTGAEFDRMMNEMGSSLLGPVAELLPQTVYVIPSGPLLGFPFDALRYNNRYLLERHTVVNLLSFPTNPTPWDSLKMTRPEKVFLAGSPQDFDSSYATQLARSADIQTVTDLFFGPGLTIIQGTALLVDEFQGDAFQQADLIHLTMPGIIDLGYAGHSKLQLSEPLPDVGRTALTPVEIQPLKLNAGLVYLGATWVQGHGRSETASQIGLVSDLLGRGAAAVIARLRVTQPKSSESMLIDFHSRLNAGGNIADALTGSKRAALKANSATASRDWAALQLFIE